MFDRFNRKIDYLRISVTDRCNLRCIYCMPEDGILLKSHDEILTFDEIIEVVKVGISLGITKIKITGGEPLVRKNIVELIEKLSSIKEIQDLSLTTNGTLLKNFAYELKKAGLKRINISLDTLDKDEYQRITRVGDINQVLEGIEAAKNAGFKPIKLNSVVFKNTSIETKNQLKEFAQKNGLEIRFISQMNLQTGEFSIVEGGSGGNCKVCNRLRLTPDGFIKPCLFSDIGYNVRELGIEKAFVLALNNKPEKGLFSLTHNFYNIGG